MVNFAARTLPHFTSLATRVSLDVAPTRTLLSWGPVSQRYPQHPRCPITRGIYVVLDPWVRRCRPGASRS
jgi:hypothetical protein